MAFDTANSGDFFSDYTENIRRVLDGIKESTGIIKAIALSDFNVDVETLYPLNTVSFLNTGEDKPIEIGHDKNINLSAHVLTLVKPINTLKQLKELLKISFLVYKGMSINYKINGYTNSSRTFGMHYVKASEIYDLKNLKSEAIIGTGFYVEQSKEMNIEDNEEEIKQPSLL